jgi:ribosomal protein S27AE
MHKNCSICKIVLLQQHQELVFWFKCPTCGFTEFDIELIHPNKHTLALKHKMLRYDNLEPLVDTQSHLDEPVDRKEEPK